MMYSKIIAAAVLGLTLATQASAQSENTDVDMQATMKPKTINRNVLALAPIQLSENGVAGVGVSYERLLDPGNIFAFYLPATLVFNTNNNYNGYTGGSYSSNDPMFYLMPGIKIYPTGNAIGKAKYALGPSLVLAAGERTTDYGYYSTPYSSYAGPVTQTHFVLGMIVNQSVNINPTPKLYIGSELGLGFSYLNRLDGINNGTEFLVQFSFKVGYRF